jgi:hypothetical protein
MPDHKAVAVGTAHLLIKSVYRVRPGDTVLRHARAPQDRKTVGSVVLIPQAG